MRHVSEELGAKLAGIISAYAEEHGYSEDNTTNTLDLADLQCSMAFIIDTLETENEDDLTLEGGIDAHFDHIPELRDRLLAAIG